MKAGVRHVDRHGFREEDPMEKVAEDEQNHALKQEYYHKMLELLKSRGRVGIRHPSQEGSDHGASDKDMSDGEEVESEIMEDDYMGDEEGELEMDEESEEEVDGEECPELVPVDQNALDRAKVAEDDSSIVSDVNVEDLSSSEAYDSDILDNVNQENPHGFVYSNMLDTFKKTRKDRILQMREDKDAEQFRDKFKKKKITKSIGKSEKVHQKNKPFMMMKKKKILLNAVKFENKLNQKKRKNKQQLGHFRKSTQQRLESKKRKG